ncbi:hypothetical protein OG455_27520 [Kitasatospora sp. NBC_01287]|uniref:hypothetical protein n=1 Tax=Kitasatospora sp. NBC_01287 TaxID=2903573 RepID=UPI0022558E6E|nr:hypothetical protein [Kitasatospora sp. NBC_01287]MCX4749210.1 hypothetical protein [Kitasatospora sp. NBC_01287]
MLNEPFPRLGLWPTCGHHSPDIGTCQRLRGHRERTDGTGPLIHRDDTNEWTEEPATSDSWWDDLTASS